MSDLFRREAVEHATRRLEGTVVLAVPFSQRLLIGLLSGVILAATVFLMTGTYARKATVQGWLVTDRGIIRATSQSAGLVQQLLVQEGQRVRRGDRIAEISLSSETTGGNSGERLAASHAAEARAIQERTRAIADKLTNEATQASRRIQMLGSELIQARGQVQLQEQRLAIAQRQIAGSEKLANSGYLTRKELDARLSAAMLAEQELQGHRRQVASIEREIAELESRLRAIPMEIATARAEQQSAEASLVQRRIDSEARRTVFVTAPLDGQVAALPVTTGQSIAAGATIAVLTPEGGQLEAELLSPTRTIGFARPGQDVRLMLQAFPHQRFGTVNGRIRTVSSTVLSPTEVSIPGVTLQEPVFRLRVVLEKNAIDAYGERIALQPGMLLSADVIFDRRSLIEWLFDPIFAVGRNP